MRILNRFSVGKKVLRKRTRILARQKGGPCVLEMLEDRLVLSATLTLVGPANDHPVSGD
jgi:hypothetical protein